MTLPESNTVGGLFDFLPSFTSKWTSVKYPLVTSAWNGHTGRQVAIKTIAGTGLLVLIAGFREHHQNSKLVSEEETSFTAGILPLRAEDVWGHSGGHGRQTAL